MYSSCAYSCPQLSDVARGLDYLHSRNVIHGALRGVCDHPKSRSIRTLTPGQSNILVDAEGHARIMGFCFTEVTPNDGKVQPASSQRFENTQWCAPEVLGDEGMTKKADIFSLAMVMIEAGHG